MVECILRDTCRHPNARLGLAVIACLFWFELTKTITHKMPMIYVMNELMLLFTEPVKSAIDSLVRWSYGGQAADPQPVSMSSLLISDTFHGISLLSNIS